ncbi:Myosin-1 [Nakaseomyces bracarensis]|uniref:Myosin-1 n=1 Tax=Nakaseomyces bracarensis TaxID=273131 RepID=A0ABR4P0R3_9SACH
MTQDMKVWVPDPNHVFVQGELLRTDIVADKFTGVEQQIGIVKIENADEPKTFKISEVSPVNPNNFDKVDNMSALTHLNEPSVLHNLENRYKDNLIYTYSGLFLVAINPYKELSDLYSTNTIKRYHDTLDETTQSPHIFEVAENAYRDLKNKSQDQSILVTGESGAGKTENTKKILQYLASITSSKGYDVSSSFEMKILQSNPILESFGNAQTVRNNNSSRFGKFIKIEFDSTGKINGAFIEWYLLEKSRITNENKNERNYHIFYQLLKGMPLKDLQSQLKLDSDDCSHYQILAESNHTVPGIDDKVDFNKLMSAFDIVGFGKDQVTSILKIIAVILLSGNIEFVSEKSEQASFKTDVSNIATLLGISESDFRTAILKPKSKAGREWVSQSKNASQARTILNSLCRSLYEKLFGYIVDTINMSLNHGSMTANYIGLLDIAGFEIFEHNSFEQLCINYTNEKLQQFFNHHMFVLEQSEYLKENIQWDYVDYGKDLQSTIDLLESKGTQTGILPLLDEESILPKSEDSSFYSKLISTWQQSSNKFRRSKLDMCFILKHYAGDVEYNVNGWLSKNKDPLNENLVNILSVSSNRLVAEFFSSYDNISSPSTSPTRLTHSSSSASLNSIGKNRNSSLKTALSRHREQQSSLLSQLALTNPHFVRCIIPNNMKQPSNFDRKLILDQLRCNGVLEGIRIAREGYPNRIVFKEFFENYRILSQHSDKLSSNENLNFKQNSQLLVSELNLDPTTYKVGTSKLFFKAGILADLESRKESILNELSIKINAVIRGWSKRTIITREIKKMQASKVVGDTLRKYNELSDDPWFNLYMKIKPLLTNSNDVIQTKKFNKKIKELEDKIDGIEKEKNSVVVKNTTITNELIDIRNLLEIEQDKLKRNEQLLEKSKNDQSLLDKKLNELQSIKETSESENIGLNSKIKELESLVMENNKDIKIKDKELIDLNIKLQKLSKEKDDIEKSISLGSKESEILNKEKVRLQEQLNKLEISIKEKDRNISRLENEAQFSNRDLDIKLETLEKNCTVAMNKLKALISENNDLKDQLDKSKKAYSDLDNLSQSKEKEIIRLKEKFSRYQAEVNGLIKERDEMAAENEHLVNEIQTLNSDLLKTKREYSALESDYQNAIAKKKELPTINMDSEILKLKKQLEEEKSLNRFLNQKIVGNQINGFEEKRDISHQPLEEQYFTLKAQLDSQTKNLENIIEENKNLISRLRFTETRLASSSFESQTARAHLKKLKQLLVENNLNIDIEEELKSISVSEANTDKVLLEVEHLKRQLAIETRAHKEAEAAISALHAKFEKIQGTESSSDIYKIKYEASEEHVKALETKLRSLPLKDRTNLPSGEIFTNKDSVSRYEEELRYLKLENFKLQEKLNDFDSVCSSLKHEIKQGSVKEILLQEQLERVQNDLKSTERQKEILASNLRQQKQQFEECLSDLNANESQLRDYNHAIKQAEDDIRGMATVIEKLKATVKQKDKSLWETETERNDLDMQLQETVLELKRVQDKSKMLEEDIIHYKERLNSTLDVTRYTSEIERLKEELERSAKYEVEYKKEISTLKYKLETLNNDSEAKIQDLVKQSQHYASLVEVFGGERDDTIAAVNELSQKLIDRESDIKKLEKIKVDLEHENQLMHSDLDRLKNLLGESTEQANNFTKENADLTEKLRLLEDTLRLQTEQNERNEEFVSTLQSQLFEYKEKHDNEKQKSIDYFEEIESLKKTNSQLQETIDDLDKRLSDNSEKESWLKKVQGLEILLNDERDAKYEEMKKTKALERVIEDLQNKNSSQADVINIANEDRGKFEESVLKYNDQMQQLERYISQQETDMKKVVRENMEYQDRISEMEKEIMLWKQRYQVVTGATTDVSVRQDDEVMVQS